ncbi:TPA: sel1 repeat family protein [Providencia rettgeri]|uniref:sel1 repeat family protein n=1 Tax=Providencia TaxID=586 RepID=UPI001BA1B821|nr:MULTISPECIES: sel1 repeat family protein [Providencia]EMB5786938.1 sel1 repeat family protein [Providencia rettgeri]HBC7428492.1 sel1 repeat family protein [Providencia rettgeri]
MQKKLFLLAVLLSGCHSDENQKYSLMPSYRMLNFNYSSEFINYDPLINKKTPTPRNQFYFNQLMNSASSGDSNSNLLLFKLFYKDSNCNGVYLNNLKPDLTCLKALEYLIESIKQNKNNSLALYELSQLYYQGVVFERNKEKAVSILDTVIHKGGKDALLVCDYLVHITLFDENRKIKDINKARYYADLGARHGSEKCKKYRNDIDEYINKN